MDERLKSGSLNAVHLAASEGMVGYFSMEIAIEPSMPTYSGGLGVLAGDTLRSAADMGLPLAAVTLVHRKGYFRQILDANGVQTEESSRGARSSGCPRKSPDCGHIEGRPVHVRAWRYDMEGVTGHTIPIYMLDTDLEANDPRDRTLTDSLYGGDTNYRLAQEIVLGIGGLRMLEALGYDVSVYHMNEGHAALLTLALLEKTAGWRSAVGGQERDLDAVRQQCVFTTHTPVPAGHDRFSMEQVTASWAPSATRLLERSAAARRHGEHDLPRAALLALRQRRGHAARQGLAARCSRNTVSTAITNGVHAGDLDRASHAGDSSTSTCRAGGEDNTHLRYAIDIPADEIEEAHADASGCCSPRWRKRVSDRAGAEESSPSGLRAESRITSAPICCSPIRSGWPDRAERRSLQILYAGKAHPADERARRSSGTSSKRRSA